MAHSKRIFAQCGPQHSLKYHPRSVPWTAIVVLVLAIIIIAALWGKVPRKPRLPYEAPAGNAPGGLVIPL